MKMIQLLPTIVGDTNHSSPSNFEAFEAIFNFQLSKKTKVYNYQFDYVGTFSLLDLAGKPQLEVMKTIIGKKLGLITERVPEPTHGDELWFLFTNMLNGNTAEDQEMMDFMVELWTNFAIFHNPTP